MVTKNSHAASLHALLRQIIDYAGLYPPASLPLDEAIGNFVRYQNDPEVWMLARFVIPARRFPELSKLAGHAFPSEGVLSFSALGRGGNSAKEFFENLDLDILEINKFREMHGSSVLVDMFETAIPTSALNDPSRSDHLATEAAD